MHAILRWLLILGCFQGLVAQRAHADPRKKLVSAEARRHLNHGNKLYNLRSFEQAIEEYKAGALIEEAPLFDYNLGQCFRQLGKYHEAIWHYERFINSGYPQGDLVDAANEFLAQIKSEFEKKPITQSPTEPAPQPASASPMRVGPVPSREKAWYDDPWGWVLSGAGVIGVTIGGGLLANATSLNGDANMTTNQQERGRLRDREHIWNVLGTITSVTGIGLLASGIVKLAIYSKERSQVTSWNIAVAGNGVLVFGRF